MKTLSRDHIKYTLGIDVSLNESISFTEEQYILIIENQLLYENFLDSIKKYAGEIKDTFLKGFSDFKDFASTLYRIINDKLSTNFADSLLRTFSNSEINKTIDTILQKVGQPDLLKNLIDKVKKISNPIGKLIASIGFTTVAKFFYDKFKELDLTKDNIKQQVSEYIKSFLSDKAIETLESFFTGGFSTLKQWLEKIGIGAATIYNTLKGTIDKYKDAFMRQDAGQKLASKLVREESKIDKDKLSQIKKGIEVEMEHTDDPKIALKIAIDHIKEDPKYYDKLAKAGLEEEKMIRCKNCGWKWKASEGGKDPYVCHKCGNDNGSNIQELNEGEFCPQCLAQYIKDHINSLQEAEYQGRKVQLGVPMVGDVKKFKVYVKNAKGNVVKVNFGQKGVKIKKNNPERRKSFRARHHCDTNPGPKWKARYWSCRKW
jgi:DNA-directed RNA polymerase subunit RPC12/RpoP